MYCRYTNTMEFHTFEMLKRVIEQSMAINEYIMKHKVPNNIAKGLSVTKINFLKDAKELLEPFRMYCKILSIEHEATISLVIPFMCNLYNNIKEKSNVVTARGKQMKIALLNQLRIVFPEIVATNQSEPIQRSKKNRKLTCRSFGKAEIISFMLDPRVNHNEDVPKKLKENSRIGFESRI